ncbi:MAG: hypothetical protein ABL931_16220 [Usitatibacteraceae bacterium]
MERLTDIVAKAICKSRTCEGVSCCQWPANGGRSIAECPVWRGGYNDAAEAAIAAMHEHDPELIAWRSVMAQYEYRDGAIYRKPETLPPPTFAKQ